MVLSAYLFQIKFIDDNIPVHPNVYSNGHICFFVSGDVYYPRAFRRKSGDIVITPVRPSIQPSIRPAVLTNLGGKKFGHFVT